MKEHPVENLFRPATEIYSAITAVCCGILALKLPGILFLDNSYHLPFALSFLVFGAYRAFQAFNLKKFQLRLQRLPVFKMKTSEIPISNKYLYLGKGFQWHPRHTQRLQQIKQIANEQFVTGSKLQQAAAEYRKSHEGSALASVLSKDSVFNPFRPPPPVGGAGYLHGLGDEDKDIRVLQGIRAQHMLIFGTTGVGKTRISDFILNQDIRNGDAVIVIDPKGDLDLVRGMYAACKVAGRLDDFQVVHLAYPEISAQYNPLKSFDNITEVATRITSAISAEGEGQQFADFAWKFTDIVAKALNYLSINITYENISFYLARLDVLLEIYCEKYMPLIDEEYLIGVQTIKNDHDFKTDKNGNMPPPMERSKAVLKYLKPFITDRLSNNNTQDIKELVCLYDAAGMDKTYYDKITASVGPVFAKINGSNAANIFSFDKSNNEVDLLSVIKNKKVLYIGLDSLSNFEVSQAVGKALLSDLVSIAGKIYKETTGEKYLLNLHVDELSEVIQESFVKILNKARGAGFRVVAYSQTKQDLEVALGSSAKAEMAKGNFSNIVMMRVENTETAMFLLDALPKVDVVSHTQVSMVTDTPHGENNTYFNTNNEDRVQMTSIDMLDASDISSIPAGQAFIKIGGNDLYKVRIPLAEIDEHVPTDIISCIKEINKISGTVKLETSKKSIRATNIESNSETILTSTSSEENKVAPVNVTELSDKPSEIEFGAEVNIEQLSVFTAWIEGRINSKNRSFSLSNQNMILCNVETFGNSVVFVKPEVLAKFQARNGSSVKSTTDLLRLSHKNNNKYYIEKDGEKLELLPCDLSEPFITDGYTDIKEEA